MAMVFGTDGNDKLAGTTTNDAITGGKGVDVMYGGAGNDAFVLRLKDMDASQAYGAGTANGTAPTSIVTGMGNHTQDVIYDFGGAGGYTAGNNDFLYLQGFGAGSSLTKVGAVDGATNHAQYYLIHSGTTGLDYLISIGSTNGKDLILGDYNFYG